MKRTSNEGIVTSHLISFGKTGDRLVRDQLDIALDRPSSRNNGKADDQDYDDNGEGWREIPVVIRH